MRIIPRLRNVPGALPTSAYAHDLLVFSVALGLYVLTLNPSVYTFDSAELVAGAYSLGIVHATGYPLYLLLAKLFTLLVPFGDIAYRANLFSALCGALALVAVRRAAELITRSRSAALLGCAFLGLCYPFWSEAVVAEVYTLHALFLGCALWLGLRWRRHGQDRDFALLALALGSSFGNHMATVLVVPGIAYLVWEALSRRRAPLPRPRTWALAGAAFLLGPLSYLYLPVRFLADPALNYAALVGVDLSTLEGVLWMVRGSMFTYAMFDYSLQESLAELWRYLGLLWGTFLGAGLLLGLAGVRDLWRRDRALLAALGTIFAANALFYANYRVFDKDTMFLPSYLIFSLWIASGIRGLREGVQAGMPRVALTLGLAGVLLVMGVTTFPRADLSGHRLTRQFAEQVLEQVPPGAVVVGGWVDITPLGYLQVVEGWRPDVRLFDYGLYILGRQSRLQQSGLSTSEARRIAYEEIRLEVGRALSTGKPVYSLGENFILEPAFELEPYSEWLFTVRRVD